MKMENSWLMIKNQTRRSGIDGYGGKEFETSSSAMAERPCELGDFKKRGETA